MTTTPRRGIPPATVAERRHRDASGELPPFPDSQKPRNGFRVPAYTETLHSPDTAAHSPDTASNGFAESQQAGLTAIISLAKTATPPPPSPAVPPPMPQPERLESPRGQAVSAVSTRPMPVIAPLAAPLVGGPRDPARPAHALPGRLPPMRTQRGREQRTVWFSHSPLQIPGLPLIIILTVQAVLSLRLIWSDTAFPDEALYLWAGHLEWAYWQHGTPIPAFATFFSGAPVIYPPLGAIADSIGGLAGPRLLSLIFMLGATVLLHGVTRRVLDQRSAVFAASLFAGLSATQYIGAFATYDAMALFFLTLATWLGVRAAQCHFRIRFILIVVAACVLTLADVTKYAATLFDPVVIAVLGLGVWRSSGRKAGIAAIITASYALCIFLAFAIHLGGYPYWQGVTVTTLTRAPGTYPIPFLLLVSVKWAGIVALLAIIGTIATACNQLGRIATILAGVLTTAAFLVPAEQARIHTYTSLFKHIGFGGWFACIPAGYAVASLARAVPRSKAARATLVGVAAVCLAAGPNITWAASHFGWPNLSQVIPQMKTVLASRHGPVLADDRGNVLDYYLPNETAHRQVLGTFFFAYNDPATGAHLTGSRAYSAAIRERFFSIIMLEFWDTARTDGEILRDLEANTGYKLFATIPYRATGQHGDVMIWVRQNQP